ncbi:MAG: ABC transporter permease subunit [Anaerolineae bacterium]|nr:ABC transporter permease subunit [Anaerolineae bacterium]
MFANVLRIEWTKTVKRKLFWGELAALALLLVVLEVFLYVIYQTNPAGSEMSQDARTALLTLLTWPGALINSLALGTGNSLGGLLVIVLVGALTAQEYTWRTLHLWLSQGTSRLSLMAAKVIALLPALLLVVLTPLVVGGLITAIFTVQLSGSLDVSQINGVQLGLSVLRTAYSLFPYATLAFLLAVVSRSAVTAIGAGLAYALLVEGVLVQILALASGTLAQASQYLPGRLASGLLSANQGAIRGTLVIGEQRITPQYLDPTTAAVGIALYTILFVGLAIWAFRRQDLTG